MAVYISYIDNTVLKNLVELYKEDTENIKFHSLGPLRMYLSAVVIEITDEFLVLIKLRHPELKLIPQTFETIKDVRIKDIEQIHDRLRKAYYDSLFNNRRS